MSGFCAFPNPFSRILLVLPSLSLSSSSSQQAVNFCMPKGKGVITYSSTKLLIPDTQVSRFLLGCSVKEPRASLQVEHNRILLNISTFTKQKQIIKCVLLKTVVLPAQFLFCIKHFSCSCNVTAQQVKNISGTNVSKG